MKNKWICDECHQKYKTKKELIECIKEHIDEASFIVDTCMGQLDELGIGDPYK